MGSNNAKYIKKQQQKKTLQNRAHVLTLRRQMFVGLNHTGFTPNTDNHGIKRTFIPKFSEHLVAFLAHR